MEAERPHCRARRVTHRKSIVRRWLRNATPALPSLYNDNGRYAWLRIRANWGYPRHNAESHPFSPDRGSQKSTSTSSRPSSGESRRTLSMFTLHTFYFHFNCFQLETIWIYISKINETRKISRLVVMYRVYRGQDMKMLLMYLEYNVT